MTDQVESTVASADGTSIAFERQGTGPPVIMIDPAGGYRDVDNIRGLAELLAGEFTVFTYDRRGRGHSGDTPPYAVTREVEDLAALVAEAGGRAHVYAFSSGGLLAVQAVAAGIGIERMVLMEPPFDVGEPDLEFGRELAALIAAGLHGDAVEYFLTGIGVPEDMLAGMRGTPSWSALEAVAPTLVYDTVLGEQTGGDVLRRATAPALVIDSEGSSDDITGSAATTAALLPHATHRSLPGGWHGVPDEALAPAVAEFLRDADESSSHVR